MNLSCPFPHQVRLKQGMFQDHMPFSYTAVFTGEQLLEKFPQKHFQARSWGRRCLNPSSSSGFRWEFQPSVKLSVGERRTGWSYFGRRVWLFIFRLTKDEFLYSPLLYVVAFVENELHFEHKEKHWTFCWIRGLYFWRNQILIRARSSSPSPPLLTPSHSLPQRLPQRVSKTWWSPPASYLRGYIDGSNCEEFTTNIVWRFIITCRRSSRPLCCPPWTAWGWGSLAPDRQRQDHRRQICKKFHSDLTETVASSLAVMSILAMTMLSSSLKCSPSSSQMGASFLQWPHLVVISRCLCWTNNKR